MMTDKMQFAPDFKLTDVDGRAVTLFEFRGKKNVALIFMRGFM
jgi:peroxiredoxin